MRQTSEGIGIASRKKKSWNDKPTTHTLTPSLKLENNYDGRATKQKCFWNFIKSRRKDNTGISPLKDKGRLFNNPKDNATILNSTYP